MKFEGQEKDSAEFARDQKNPAYRKSLKQWLQRGIPLYAARFVAREDARKPTNQ